MSSRIELAIEIEQFLFLEARLLDTWELRQWLDLFTSDTRYLIPIRETLPTSVEGLHSETEIAVHHVDEDFEGLELRVRRIETGRAHAEEPRTRARRFVTNVEILEDQGDEILVNSNLLLFQGRHDLSEVLLSAQRRDLLRRVEGGLKIARRRVLLDHTVLPRPMTQFL